RRSQQSDQQEKWCDNQSHTSINHAHDLGNREHSNRFDDVHGLLLVQCRAEMRLLDQRVLRRQLLINLQGCFTSTCPQPPPPGDSIRMRSPFRSRVLNFPGISSTGPPARIRLAFPGDPASPPAKPHGPRVRRSASRVTSQSVSTSISRTIPSPPRCSPAPPLPGRSEYRRTRSG